MARKRTTSNNFSAPDTPLNAKQRAIAEQEAKLKAQEEKLQRLIAEAPKIAKERERVRREQFISRASRTEARPGSHAALPDRRYDLNVGVPAKQRRLRAERNRGRMTFFILLLVLAASVLWLYYTIQPS
ncbi:MAG: hypothetical protein ACO1QR_14970 [Chthoniobacteraceae bacterium]